MLRRGTTMDIYGGRGTLSYFLKDLLFTAYRTIRGIGTVLLTTILFLLALIFSLLIMLSVFSFILVIILSPIIFLVAIVSLFVTAL